MVSARLRAIRFKGKGHLRAFDAKTGEPRLAIPGVNSSAYAITDTHAICHGGNGPLVVDLKAQKIAWHNTYEEALEETATIVVGNTILYTEERKGAAPGPPRIIALDVPTGKERWRWEYPVQGTPGKYASFGNLTYADGKLYGFCVVNNKPTIRLICLGWDN